MIRVYLLLLIVAAFFWMKGLFKTPVSARSGYIKRSVLAVFILSLLVLALSGRLNGVFAVLGVLIALLVRFLPLLLRYGVQVQKIFSFIQPLWQQRVYKKSVLKQEVLSQQAACELLGVTMSASKQEIIKAHRILMLKNHPDKGGSADIAAKINQAKDRLLKYK